MRLNNSDMAYVAIMFLSAAVLSLIGIVISEMNKN